jgi:SAM-dependent methyltransferase
LRILKNLDCAICRNHEFKYLFGACDRLLGIEGDFSIYKCLSCGLKITVPQLNDNELSSYYPKHYEPFERSKSSRIRDEKGKRNRKWIRWLYGESEYLPHLPPGENILEVGCASGYFLETLKDKGWRLFGVEVNKESVQFARTELQLNVFHGNLAEANFPNNFFGAVFAWHTLEHLQNPVDSVKEILRILRPGGYFIFNVPNAGSWEFSVFRNRWYGLDVPRHLFHFEKNDISNILRQQNFSIQEIYFEKNRTNIIMSFCYIIEEIFRIDDPAWLRRKIKESKVLAILLRPFMILASKLCISGRMRVIALKK